MDDSLENRLRAFSARQGVSLTTRQIGQLVRLDQMIGGWDRALGVSGFRDADERFQRYLAEPLDASRWFPGREGAVLDIGTGGGSPALPLAIVRPGNRWTLLEPNRRRAVFLEEALAGLGLSGSRVIRSRWEDFALQEPFVVITSRGVALKERLLQKMAHWLEPEGRLLLFTGLKRSEELFDREGSLRRAARVALAPGLKAWLVVLEKPSETSAASFT